MALMALAVVNRDAWLQTLGRMHVVTVHLPISLLLVAALIELWRAIRRQKGVSQTSITCLVLGAISAVGAAGMGLVHQHYMEMDGAVIHKWLGIASAALAILVLLLWKTPVFRTGIIACGVLVSVAGHFGGALTHGDGYLTELIFPKKTEVASNVSQITAPATQRTYTVDFIKDVHPVLAESCFECHSEKAHKGNLRLDTAGDILAGGTSGPLFVSGKADESLLIKRVLGMGTKKRMPIDHPPLSDAKIAMLKTWVNEGANFSGEKAVAKKRWQPPLEPNYVEVTSPIDQILTKYYQQQKFTAPAVVDDRTYARRVYEDIIGLLPTPQELDEFIADTSPDKRVQLAKKLLNENRAYAEHWMSFWNDALRNDYQGPGYIDGGREQITDWLFHSMLNNKPYDKFVAELINPSNASEGFTKGIVWRGAVSASQRPELQAAQNISQVFMGINMKCNSCHDSFISDWKLADAYGLASVYSDKPLEIYRCEKPMGTIAPVKFMYPKLGTIDGSQPKEKRKEQLAKLMTCPGNGRLPRTMVNRLWAKLMGRGLVEPVDEMDNEPWDPQLLDFLAHDLADNDYNLKHTIQLIVTSKAYQLPSVGMKDPTSKQFTFAGPVVKRMSAEQFCDAVSQLTGIWHDTTPAPVGEINFTPGQVIWNDARASVNAPAGKVSFHKEFELADVPIDAVATGVADNSFTLWVNGKRATSSKDLNKPAVADIAKMLVCGKNVFDVVAANDPGDPNANPAGFWMVASIRLPDKGKLEGRIVTIATDRTWKCANGVATRAATQPIAWRETYELGSADKWNVEGNLKKSKKQWMFRDLRSVWANNDPLMTALGRPNREQVVTYRSTAATTLQMLELANGDELGKYMQKGAANWQRLSLKDDQERIEQIYHYALGRPASPAELQTAKEMIGSPATKEGYEDLLWSILMLPEFQLVY